MTGQAPSVGDFLDTAEQLVTIGAVLLGALMSHVTSYVTERQKNRHELTTRWDAAKLDAYVNYIDQVRIGVFAAVQMYEHRTGLRESDKSVQEMTAEMSDVGRQRGGAFERVLMLGGDDVVEAAHELNTRAVEVDWQAAGKIDGELEEWRERNRAVFRAINDFHETTRVDLGVQGSVTGEGHAQRDLLLPPQRDEGAGGSLRRDRDAGPVE